jgi:hypothetical protein
MKIPDCKELFLMSFRYTGDRHGKTHHYNLLGDGNTRSFKSGFIPNIHTLSLEGAAYDPINWSGYSRENTPPNYEGMDISPELKLRRVVGTDTTM